MFLLNVNFLSFASNFTKFLYKIMKKKIKNTIYFNNYTFVNVLLVEMMLTHNSSIENKRRKISKNRKLLRKSLRIYKENIINARYRRG